MAKRKIIDIDEEKCTGCGLCIPNCPEGALQVIDGKVRLISDLFCDGLGACIGHCPEGAIAVIEREAKPYDESKVMVNIVKAGKNTIKSHLEHLRDHNEIGYLNQAIEYLEKKNIPNPMLEEKACKQFHACPGSRIMDFSGEKSNSAENARRNSELRQWPVQLHLISPTATYYQGKDMILVADCVAYAMADFHKDFLKGKSIAIACPKLDSEMEVYVDKLVSLIDDAKIDTLTVLTMEVPCCQGLLMMAKNALGSAKRKIPIKSVVVGIKGDIISEEWK